MHRMPRPGVLLLAMVSAVGAWLVLSQGNLPSLSSGTGGWPTGSDKAVELAATNRSTPAFLRIATLDLNGFGSTELSKPDVMQILIRVCDRFDVIALQRITSPEAFILPGIIDQLNQHGRHFDFVVGPRTGEEGSQQQLAIVFDADRVEVDRMHMYSVADPDDLMLHEPLVASFRCRGLPPREAFTFSLVNVYIDESEVERERSVLKQIYQSVTQDGRHEDDVLLLGNFQTGAKILAELFGASSMRTTVVELRTGIATGDQSDNLVFSVVATTEFTGRTGVSDFLRELNLSAEQARELTDHLPVWAEFTVNEGGVPGRVASARLNSGPLSSTAPQSSDSAIR